MTSTESAVKAAIALTVQDSLLVDLTADQRQRYDAELAQHAPALKGLVNCESCGWCHPVTVRHEHGARS